MNGCSSCDASGGSAWLLAFRRPEPGWSTSDSHTSWPRLVSAHYFPTALPKPTT